jgi:DNA-binding Lrp family transcriptional regulator
MDDKDLKILETINSISPKSFVSPIEVNELLGLNETELGSRLVSLKKSGQVDYITNDYASSNTLPNLISRVRITESGQQSLKGSL